MSTYTKAFVESIRGYIFSKAMTLFKKQIQSDDVFSMEQLLSTETWDPIFKKINNEIIFYCNIREKQEAEAEDSPTKTNTIVDTNLDTLYPSETLNDYVQRIGNLQRLGAYEYIDFYKKLEIPEFRERIKQGYEQIEEIKMVKREIVVYVLSTLGYLKLEIEPIEAINLIPVFEYISEKNIDCSNLEQEPLYKDFRSNKHQYFEMYTLWTINNV